MVEDKPESNKIELSKDETSLHELMSWCPAVSETEAFFNTKGLAFKSLWMSKISKGMSYEDTLRLKTMIALHIKKQNGTVPGPDKSTVT